MARTRNLKPAFFKNEDLGELAPLARLLYEGLWCWANSRGYMEDRPGRLKVEILPYDLVDVDNLLWQLHEKGFIVRYEVENKRYIWIPTFLNHQHPNENELQSESKIPALAQNSGKIRSRTELVSPYTLNLIPHTSNLEINTCSHESHACDGVREIARPGETLDSSFLLSAPPGSPPVCPDAREPLDRKAEGSTSDLVRAWFDTEFWPAYPRKLGKSQALAAARQKGRSEDRRKEIMLGLVRQLPELRARERQFIPYAATWLRQERWEDEPEPPPLNPSDARREAYEKALREAEKEDRENGLNDGESGEAD